MTSRLDVDTIMRIHSRQSMKGIDGVPEEQFDKMIGTNLKGVLFAVQSAVPLMDTKATLCGRIQRRKSNP